jgi:hypothetical protein
MVLLLPTGIHRVLAHNHEATCRELSTFRTTLSSTLGVLVV